MSLEVPFDKYGLITEQNGNGGDSANRMGFWVWLWWARDRMFPDEGFDNACIDFNKAIGWLEPHELVFIRHPDQAPDAGQAEIRDFAKWNDWNNFSRDQWLPLVTAIGLTDVDKFKRILRTTLKRHGTMPNGDLLGPGHWAHVYRIATVHKTPGYLGWAGLYLGDLYNLFGFLIGACGRGTSDSLNGFLMLLTAYLMHPTFISRLSLRFVKMFGKYPGKWAMYFGHANGAQLHKTAEPLFKEYL